MVVKRVYDNLSTLKSQKENGRAVGMLKWKPPREYRSLTYNQSGFKLKNTSGRPVLWLSKIGEIPIHLHREIPEDATIKQVTVKQESTGEWFATFGIDVDEDTPEKPENPERAVGVDVGILKYVHDTDGTASSHQTSPTNANGWNVPNATSLERNTARTIGSNSARRSPNVMAT